ncbi:MAG: phospho-sugar mutase, partial [Oscillospiraceae bacterium]|nr:phospho-sugar mutase [Oscillospiraceae bacterium]
MQAELLAIANDEEALKGSFGGDLQFGTAGMRGVMGVGTNRLNYYTVRRAAQGMASWLSATDLPQTAAIGYDSRHNSKLFAEVCAVAFAECGIKTYLFDRLAPTPMLSYAVRKLGCGCGIVISASHNAGAYNGVKCYGPDGCQMTDEPAAIVTDKIAQIPYFVPEKKTFDVFCGEGLICYINQELWEEYYKTVLAEAVDPDVIKKANVHLVYTPLCGTGNEPVREVLGRLGADVAVVSCQENPDGDFKTCEYPNPETDAALNESYKTARTVPCDLILGTDPECDRVAIAVPDGDGFRKLSGNDLGCLLMDYILKARTERGDLPEQAMVVRSIVSSPLADRIAEYYHVNMVQVLTGFKYIGGAILELEKLGVENRFVFGFEESCGYLKG